MAYKLQFSADLANKIPNQSFIICVCWSAAAFII